MGAMGDFGLQLGFDMLSTKNRRISVSEDMVVFAFRYCINRQTGAVNICVDHLMAVWNQLNGFTKEEILKDIKTAYRTGAVQDGDRMFWDRILALELTN